jgi:hypothetical protein
MAVILHPQAHPYENRLLVVDVPLLVEKVAEIRVRMIKSSVSGIDDGRRVPHSIALFAIEWALPPPVWNLRLGSRI